MENTTKSRAYKIRNLRKSIDLLTSIFVIQLNKINRLLIELEQEK